MKQNERLLVYAVTGFLALILVVAVLFSRDPAKEAHGGSTKSVHELDDLLDRDGQPVADKAKAPGDGSRTGLPAPGDVSPQQPLAAAPKVMLAADLVAQQLGTSRRDRTVRLVRVKPNDSLESLVRRWCGARDPWLAETKCLNEELVVLRAGQEIAVPWVDDDVLLAALEAQQPKTLLGNAASTPADGTPGPSAAAGARSPSFVVPGAETGSGAASGAAAGGAGADRGRAPALSLGTTYTVKKGDALWSIAARTYGRKHADRMVAEIKAANPGLGDGVREGQKIVLPKDPNAGA